MGSSDWRAAYERTPGREGSRSHKSISDCALFQDNVNVQCRRCGNVKVFDGCALWWLFERKKWDQGLTRAARRFWCVPCSGRMGGKISDAVLTVSSDIPTGRQPPMPSEREWKRLVKLNRT